MEIGEKIYFKGMLANVDSSILQMVLDHGFKLESFSEKEAITLLYQLEKIPPMTPPMTIVQKYFFHLQCFNINEQKTYAVSNTLENVSCQDSSTRFNETAKFDNVLVRGYLEPMFRLMRLFKEGDIRMPVTFYYQVQNDKIGPTMHSEYGRVVSNEPYHLDTSEMSALRSFIQSVKLPFRKEFLHLAFENLELSYESPDLQLAFLVTMIGLETLLNPSEYEVAHRVCRNLAVLIGENRTHSEEIFAQVKELYHKRSDIVHSGKRRVIKKGDLLKSRDYLRKAIKEIYRIGMNKKEIMALCDSHGFGEKV